MKIYAAIGHFKGNENITTIAGEQTTKKAFMADCYGNEFVPYVVITENMLEKLLGCSDSLEIFEQVKKMTSNYRVWTEITDYIEQCADIIAKKVKTTKERA